MPLPLATLIPAVGGLLGGIFGGRKERSINRGLDDYVDSSQERYNPYIASRTQNIGDAQTRSTNLFNQISQGYGDILGGNGADIQNRGAIQGDINALRDFGRNPISAQDQARARGGGGYEEFARTGGFSPADLERIRVANSSITPSFFSALQGQLARQNRVSGGLNPGFTSQQIALARAGGREAQRANLEADIGLQNAVREGRMWGIGGMSDSEMNLQNLLTRSKLAGMQGALQGEEGLASIDSGEKARALAGLSDLYRSAPGEVNMYDRELLQLLGMGQEAESDARRLQLGYNPNNSGDFFTRFARFAGPLSTVFQGRKDNREGSQYAPGVL